MMILEVIGDSGCNDNCVAFGDFMRASSSSVD